MPVNVDGQDIRTRIQAVSVAVGQKAVVQHVMRDLNGDPVDLEPCVPPGEVRLRIREVTSFHSSNPGVELACTLVNPPGNDGLVETTLDADTVAFPGISKAEFALLTDAVPPEVVFTNGIYIVVNRGQWGDPSNLQDTGPPTIPEIRLHLRDSAPEDNLWLGITEFDLAEIAACIERPILYFNESRPPLKIRYTTSNFPYRYYWLEGITSCLYNLASLHYNRVHLPYQQQGGLMVDDKNKFQQYAAIADKRWEEYKDWVQKVKVAINAMGAIQVVSSPYYSTLWFPNRSL